MHNPQVDLHTLPTYRQLDLQPPAPAYLRVMLLERSLFIVLLLGGVLALITLVLHWHPFWRPAVLLGTVFIFWSALLWLAQKAFANKGYALRQHDVVIKKGWLFEKIQIVPLNKIQHTIVKTGPLERLFGISGLQLFTAGDADAVISGLSRKDAAALKDWIALRLPKTSSIPATNPHYESAGD